MEGGILEIFITGSSQVVYIGKADTEVAEWQTAKSKLNKDKKTKKDKKPEKVPGIPPTLVASPPPCRVSQNTESMGQPMNTNGHDKNQQQSGAGAKTNAGLKAGASAVAEAGVQAGADFTLKVP